jgi:soluble lytic murein transglycosylase
LLLARTYWTENEVKKARKVLDKIQKNIVNKTSLAELFWIRGRMEEEVQNFSGSISWFQKALSETVDSQSFRDKINWYLAWNYRKTKDYSNAIKILEDIKEHSENGLERSRVMFWLARTLNDSGEKGDAKDIYKNLIKEDPLGYYSLIAHREMDEPFETKIFKSSDKNASYKKDDSHLPHSLLTQIDLSYFNWLVATKESQIAGDYLETVAARLRKDKKTEDETWSALFYLYAKTENYISLFNQLNSLKPGVRKAIISENTEIIFPNPFFETVSQAANRFGISPEFIYSIMRQESSFNPQARSQMDAFGLMQLLPEVAKKSADANAITLNGDEDLYLPYVNIPIGSAYLRELWDKYNGELVLAVASYNASEPAIISWLKTRYRGDTLEFIEDIPYDETRDYVKLVLRNLISYQIINTKTDSSSFPEWTLKISERDTASPKGKKN